jgi:hypothetical protein
LLLGRGIPGIAHLLLLSGWSIPSIHWLWLRLGGRAPRIGLLLSNGCTAPGGLLLLGSRHTAPRGLLLGSGRTPSIGWLWLRLSRRAPGILLLLLLLLSYRCAPRVCALLSGHTGPTILLRHLILPSPRILLSPSAGLLIPSTSGIGLRLSLPIGGSNGSILVFVPTSHEEENSDNHDYSYNKPNDD